MSTTPKSVEASLKYLANDTEVAVYIASVGGGDVTEHKGNYVMQPVSIRNARGETAKFSLDREGFVLVSQPSAVDDFYNDDEIRAMKQAYAEKQARGEGVT